MPHHDHQSVIAIPVIILFTALRLSKYPLIDCMIIMLGGDYKFYQNLIQSCDCDHIIMIIYLERSQLPTRTVCVSDPVIGYAVRCSMRAYAMREIFNLNWSIGRAAHFLIDNPIL